MWKSRDITVAYLGPSGPATRQVPAQVLYPGGYFAVHKRLHGGPYYSVTHVPTGWAMSEGAWAYANLHLTLDMAKDAASLLNDVPKPKLWDFTETALIPIAANEKWGVVTAQLFLKYLNPKGGVVSNAVTQHRSKRKYVPVEERKRRA